MDNPATLLGAFLAVIGILGTCVGALVWVIKYLFKEMLPMLRSVKESTDANTGATKSADQYLRDRNGRDSEKHAELLKATQAIPKTMKVIANAQAKAILEAVKDTK